MQTVSGNFYSSKLCNIGQKVKRVQKATEITYKVKRMNIKKSKEDEGATVPERVFCKAIKPFV
jgi:hypothetical protein